MIARVRRLNDEPASGTESRAEQSQDVNRRNREVLQDVR
jgi:hypothetical protein